MRPKLAIVHPEAWYGGGAESRPPWIIQALRGDYDITLITAGIITNGTYSVDRVNKYYGTKISEVDFKLVHYRPGFFLDKTRRFSSLKKRLFQRFLKKHLPEYDAVISTSSFTPVDLGRAIIRFVVAFDFDRTLCDKLEPPPKEDVTGGFLGKALQYIHQAFLDLIFPADNSAWLKDQIVSNSDWTGAVLSDSYNIRTRTLYPPVWSEFQKVPYEERGKGFVWVGVFAPQKEVESAIEILSRVRARGYNVHLHIVGWGYSDSYMEQIEKLHSRHKDWVFMEGRCELPEKLRLLSTHRYGINSRAKEPFGIAVAEMVKAGCIVFCPDSGGQVEIVGDDRLTFGSMEDAVDRICAVLDSEKLQKEILSKLSERACLFSVETFQAGVRGIVEAHIKEKEKEGLI